MFGEMDHRAELQSKPKNPPKEREIVLTFWKVVRKVRNEIVKQEAAAAF